MASQIINGKRYALEKRNLLCEAFVCKTFMLMDFNNVVQKLYYPKGKDFVMVTTPILGNTITEIISEKEALDFMNRYSDGIVEENYIKFFGEPEEV